MSQQLRLVIADDESLIRMNLKETLVGLGYLVVGVTNQGVDSSAFRSRRQQRRQVAVTPSTAP